MVKAYITTYDAFALLEKRKLYPDELSDVLIDELHAKKILCLSDTTDVLLENHETASVAHTLESAKLQPPLEIVQSDFMDFRYLSEQDREDAPKFGAHLPQSEHESRREYKKINSKTLEEDVADEAFDLILGRNCICACAGDGNLCGGIDISVQSQQRYLTTLIDRAPSLIVLTACSAMFYPSTPEEEEQSQNAQILYNEAKKNMMMVCNNLNAEDTPYRFELIEPDRNLKFIATGPKNENGYMVVAYDSRKINFQPSTQSPQNLRQQEKIEDLKRKLIAKKLGDNENNPKISVPKGP